MMEKNEKKIPELSRLLDDSFTQVLMSMSDLNFYFCSCFMLPN